MPVSKYRRRAVLWTLVLLAVSCFPADAAEIQWYPYREGVAAARNEGKKIFLHFYADWCTYCKKVASESFRDEKVVDYLTRNFISIRVDTERQKKIASRYRVRALPTTWFVSDRGENISSRPGYLPTALLFRILQYIHTDSYKHTPFSRYVPGKP